MKDNSGNSEGGEVPKLTKEQAFLRLLNDGLSEMHAKKVEYTECAVSGNPNWEYFKGKADAYEYAHKTFKRILEWTATGSVADPKPDTLKEYHAYLNYEDVQKENEELRDSVKELYEVVKAISEIPTSENTFILSVNGVELKPMLGRAKALLEH